MRAWAAGIAFVIAAPAVAQFHLVGFPSGYTSSRVYGLSMDGRTAVGYSVSNSGESPGFTWSPAVGRSDHGLAPGMPFFTHSTAISGDASTIAGAAGDGGSPPRAFRYHNGGAIEYLGDIFPGQASYAYGLNHDGSIVVGTAVAGNGQASRGFRWTQSSGMQPIGTQFVNSSVAGISRDGSTLVGGGDSNAFIWTESGGVTILANAPGSDFGSNATAVNHNGSIVVGGSGPGGGRATIWNNGQPTLLPHPAGYRASWPNAVSDDGRVVAGHLQPMSGALGVAFVYTPDRGTELLANYLAFFNVSVPQGWSLTSATSVSADGSTIGGLARFNGQTQGFVVTVPTPGSSTLLCALCVFGARRRRYPQFAQLRRSAC